MTTQLEHLEAKAQDIGQLIGNAIPEDVGFVLTLANFGEGGFITYVSNQNRDDTIHMLREMIGVLTGHREKKVYPFEEEPE